MYSFFIQLIGSRLEANSEKLKKEDVLEFPLRESIVGSVPIENNKSDQGLGIHTTKRSSEKADFKDTQMRIESSEDKIEPHKAGLPESLRSERTKEDIKKGAAIKQQTQGQSEMEPTVVSAIGHAMSNRRGKGTPPKAKSTDTLTNTIPSPGTDTPLSTEKTYFIESTEPQKKARGKGAIKPKKPIAKLTEGEGKSGRKKEFKKVEPKGHPCHACDRRFLSRSSLYAHYLFCTNLRESKGLPAFFDEESANRTPEEKEEEDLEIDREEREGKEGEWSTIFGQLIKNLPSTSPKNLTIKTEPELERNEALHGEGNEDKRVEGGYRELLPVSVRNLVKEIDVTKDDIFVHLGSGITSFSTLCHGCRDRFDSNGGGSPFICYMLWLGKLSLFIYVFGRPLTRIFIQA